MTKVSETERTVVWDLALRLLEHYVMAQTNPALLLFAWHVAHFVWHAIIHILHELRIPPANPEAENAWDLVEQVFDLNRDVAGDSRKLIYVAVGHLCLKAHDQRQNAAGQTFTSSRKSEGAIKPGYIVRLRALVRGATTREQQCHPCAGPSSAGSPAESHSRNDSGEPAASGFDLDVTTDPLQPESHARLEGSIVESPSAGQPNEVVTEDQIVDVEATRFNFDHLSSLDNDSKSGIDNSLIDWVSLTR